MKSFVLENYIEFITPAFGSAKDTNIRQLIILIHGNQKHIYEHWGANCSYDLIERAPDYITINNPAELVRRVSNSITEYKNGNFMRAFELVVCNQTLHPYNKGQYYHPDANIASAIYWIYRISSTKMEYIYSRAELDKKSKE